MEANSYSRVIFESPTALRVWCIAAGLTLAPLPAIYALPSMFINFLFESPLPIWTRMTMREPYLFSLLGFPVTMIFLAWSLPGVSRTGLPLRSIVVLCLLVAYNPLRYYFETHFYSDRIARVAEVYSWDSPLLWSIRHLDTPLLIGLAAAALFGRHTLPPIWKVLFHWGLFVCMLWAAGHPYDSLFSDFLIFRAFGA